MNNQTNLFSFYGVELNQQIERIYKAAFRKAEIQLKKILKDDKEIWRVIETEEGEKPYYVDFENYEEALDAFNFWSSTIENKNVNLALIPEFELRN